MKDWGKQLKRRVKWQKQKEEGKNRRRRTTPKSELKEKVEVSQQIPRAEQGTQRERRMDSDVEETKDAIRKEYI